MAIHLRIGMTRWRDSSAERSAGSAAALAGRLHRRLRKALIACARASLRSGTPKDRQDWQHPGSSQT